MSDCSHKNSSTSTPRKAALSFPSSISSKQFSLHFDASILTPTTAPLLSGYKISERTIPGTMDDLELVALFTGYGYQTRFVEYGALPQSAEEAEKKLVDLNKAMAVTFEWAYTEIRKIQTAARSGKPISKPRWPVIIMRTPKARLVPLEFEYF